MTYSIILRFHAPIQSYGAETVVRSRGTEGYPTKSAIIGFLGACLGRKRGDSVDDLNSLNYTVVAEKTPVQKVMDFQVFRERNQDQTFAKSKNTKILTKDYLVNKTFYICVEFESNIFRDSVLYALTHPVYAPYLGRKCCVPAQPYVLGSYDNVNTKDDLLDILKNEGYEVKNPIIRTTKKVGNPVTVNHVKDTPVDTSRYNRKFSNTLWYRVR